MLFRTLPSYGNRVASSPIRLNISLDPERAAKLALLAERTHMETETLARSLLSQAIDEADVDARRVVEVLDGIPNAFERARLGLAQARAGNTVAVDEL
jgi:hypothetical protein